MGGVGAARKTWELLSRHQDAECCPIATEHCAVSRVGHQTFAEQLDYGAVRDVSWMQFSYRVLPGWPPICPGNAHGPWSALLSPDLLDATSKSGRQSAQKQTENISSSK